MIRLLVVALLSSSASAQTVLFHEDFEDGLAGWSATGLWNAQDAAEICSSGVQPFPSGTGAAYFGIDSACNYDLGNDPSFGQLRWDGWIDLPAGAASITLRYWSWSETEHCWGDWDLHAIEVRQEGGPLEHFSYCDNPPSGTALPQMRWHERRHDLTHLAGSRIWPSFHFYSVDGEVNEGRGWFVDEVSVIVEPGVRVCPDPGFVSGCPCGPTWIPVAGGCRNSTQQSAVCLSSGSPTVSSDTLGITARNMPPNASCLLTQASGFGTPVVFGDGIRCVSGSLRRMGSLAASNGTASWPPAGSDPISVRGGVPASGGTRYYYVYYRDVLNYCSPATYNLTDMQRIVWAP